MVRLKSADEIEMMRLAGRVVAECLAAMRDAIVPDRTRTIDLDEIAATVFARRGARSAFLGYRPSFSNVPYAHNTCISVNEEVVHGGPGKRVLRDGDVVSLDTGASINGWHADSAITVAVGQPSERVEGLLAATRAALFEGISQAHLGLDGVADAELSLGKFKLQRGVGGRALRG